MLEVCRGNLLAIRCEEGGSNEERPISTRNPACGTFSFKRASEISQAVKAPEQRAWSCSADILLVLDGLWEAAELQAGRWRCDIGPRLHRYRDQPETTKRVM